VEIKVRFIASSQEDKLKAQQRPTYCAPMACIFGEHETVKKVRPPLRTMPDDGTRVVYRTVISTYPGMMPAPIALDMLKQYWVVVLLGFAALAFRFFRRRIILAAFLPMALPSAARWVARVC
jgi:hypothetical protein